MPISLATQLQFLCLVFVGGGIGAVARYGVSLAALSAFGPHFPWGTLAINVIGSLVMGVFAGWLMTRQAGSGSDAFRLFFMTGILGGFTTFSAFSLDAVVLWQRGATLAATGYVAASVAVSILALVAALAATRAMFAS
ncbi:fluoride efflux transporter CrcB [Siculibacillus lacustris]|uniref:Fluoride-specific ion channel FluC n=1 Tax=Siculibacillus lacustris TaxID=1549641 RepID=A0A4Q9VGC8_9HYPH|nr:fluoride efflux transporter CrcB [Siculibacillus lacustris]TBW34068.1 fluoride efflux transporter CrcB [Siculibacillus lacustris]